MKMTEQGLDALAAKIKAENTAKHKALGKTHRVEVNTYTARDVYVRTAVFYVKGEPNVGALAIKAGTKSISSSVMSAKVEAL